MTPDFLLERARLDDLPAILPLVRDLHDAEHVDLDESTRANAVRALIQRTDIGGIWVIRVGADVVGYLAIAFGFSIVFGGRDAFLDEICISAEWRGRGLGGAALTRIKSLLAELDIKALHLEVNVDNHRAQRLYGNHGFAMRRQYHLMTAEL